MSKFGKRSSFKPLGVTTYLFVKPRGNPGHITELADLAKPGCHVAVSPCRHVAMSPKASLPRGGQAAIGLLKKAGILEPRMKNVLDKDASCIQRTIQEVAAGKADAMIVASASHAWSASGTASKSSSSPRSAIPGAAHLLRVRDAGRAQPRAGRCLRRVHHLARGAGLL